MAILLVRHGETVGNRTRIMQLPDIPLSDVMVSLEQANLSMQMAANVRDKVVAAYSNVMNMQV